MNWVIHKVRNSIEQKGSTISKSSRTNVSDSPRYFDVSVDEDTLKNVVPHSVATALASIVFPVPCGPTMRTPCEKNLADGYETNREVFSQSGAAISVWRFDIFIHKPSTDDEFLWKGKELIWAKQPPHDAVFLLPKIRQYHPWNPTINDLTKIMSVIDLPTNARIFLQNVTLNILCQIFIVSRRIEFSSIAVASVILFLKLKPVSQHRNKQTRQS